MNRLEYIIWRDTIRYKYQLDKTSQLGEKEIEEKIDELEKTMSESMPYFFDGKDDDMFYDDSYINLCKGFFNSFNYFTVLEDDWRKWSSGELLFCGECFHTLSQYIKCPERPRRGDKSKEEYRDEIRRYRENEYKDYQNKIEPYYELTSYPLRSYNDIINVYRQSEYYVNYDYTNPESIMKLLTDEHIMVSYHEFYHQRGYKKGYHEQKLPNGIEVVTFYYRQYDEVEKALYEDYLN